MPRHRARGRSPHREGAPYPRERLREGQVPAEETQSDALLEGAQDAVRIAAEVVDIALVAAAVAMRELVVRLNGRDGASGASSSDHR
jgi:hypothetical protein